MPANQTVASWLSAVSAAVAAAALAGAFVLYGDVRALQQYSERDTEDMSNVSEDMAKITQLLAKHSELMAKMGTLCSENFKRFDRLEPRLEKIEGNRWTFEMQNQAEQSLRRELSHLAREIGKNLSTIESLTQELAEHRRGNHR